jgi:hypothetical protein
MTSARSAAQRLTAHTERHVEAIQAYDIVFYSL